VQSGVLWMTNVCYMNDSEELLWLFRLAKEGFSAEGQERYTLLVADIVRVLTRKSYGQVYATCFSEDDDSLSQWRAYADDGRGVAIGLRFDKPNQDRAVELQLVDYANNNEALLLGMCFGRSLGGPFANETDRRIAESRFLDHVLTCGARIKNDGFRSEKEWRLIHHSKSVEDSRMANRKYREASGFVIPYHEYELKRCSMVRIMFGPKCNLPTNRDSVSWMLKQHGHDGVLLEQSRLTYR
jgi:hypothetical protein